ncbi:MAG: hypothetical protein ONB44_02070 [candidate division KSB1 bacterium]|nr:hypothetical protein [candidate division KSB1 bacterium]MDZ7300909.1 hypothetical protein [candidate division KSB1 bacterium]MDZ7314061.1 hypothetical protein [candidate division KSB1 bacterium]
MNSREQPESDPHGSGLELQRRLTKQIKILEIEKSLANRRGFWKGLLMGFLLAVVLLVGMGLIVWQNRAKVVEFAATHFLMDYAENLFAGFPEAYMTNRRERVLLVLDEFTNAMAAQQISREDFKDIARQVFAALRDQRLTYQELDALLDRLEQASRSTP